MPKRKQILRRRTRPEEWVGLKNKRNKEEEKRKNKKNVGVTPAALQGLKRNRSRGSGGGTEKGGMAHRIPRCGGGGLESLEKKRKKKTDRHGLGTGGFEDQEDPLGTEPTKTTKTNVRKGCSMKQTPKHRGKNERVK